MLIAHTLWTRVSLQNQYVRLLQDVQCAQGEDAADSNLLLQWHLQPPYHWPGKPDKCEVDDHVRYSSRYEHGKVNIATSRFPVECLPDQGDRNAFEQGGEEKGDAPAYNGRGQDPDEDVKQLPPEDTTIEQGDGYFGERQSSNGQQLNGEFALRKA